MKIDTNGITLGAYVKDTITGMEGHVTGIAAFITGCAQLLVQPKMDGDNKFVEPRFFDVPRLEMLDAERLELGKKKHDKVRVDGGPSSASERPPIR